MAWVITLLLLPLNRQSWIRGTEYVSRFFFDIKQELTKQWVEPESINALKTIVEGRSEVVTGRKRESDLKGAEALRQTSLIARLGSMQPKVHVEIKRLLSIFLRPQLVCCQTWFWVKLSWLFPWLLWQRRKFVGTPYLYVLLLHRTNINCLRNDMLTRWW